MDDRFWVLLGIAVLLYLVIQGFRGFRWDAQLRKDMPVIDFHVRWAAALKELRPETWRRDYFWLDRDYALAVLDDFIREAQTISVPPGMQANHRAFQAFLRNVRHEWAGYPYRTAEEQQDWAARWARVKQSAEAALAEYSAIRTPGGVQRKYRWQLLLFGPPRS